MITHHPTPLLVDTSVDSFDSYIKSLAKTGRKNFNYVEKHNKDIEYRRVMQYTRETKQLLHNFMYEVWEKQKVRGASINWGFDISFLDFLNYNGNLMIFIAADHSKEGQIVAAHFVERYGDYVDCHPPMYNKTPEHQKRYLAKYMWFSLISYCIWNEKINWIDFGGGHRGSWRNLLINREEHIKKLGYKWLYVPKEVKDNPERQPRYVQRMQSANDEQNAGIYFKYLALEED